MSDEKNIYSAYAPQSLHRCFLARRPVQSRLPSVYEPQAGTHRAPNWVRLRRLESHPNARSAR
jgi:hypothetical protein